MLSSLGTCEDEVGTHGHGMGILTEAMSMKTEGMRTNGKSLCGKVWQGKSDGLDWSREEQEDENSWSKGRHKARCTCRDHLGVTDTPILQVAAWPTITPTLHYEVR